MSHHQRDLRDRTQQFALRIIRMFGALTKTTEAQVLGKQVLRSGTSIGANYREAFRARSDSQFIAKMGDCLREADETDYWLALLVGSGQISSERLAALQDETDQLIAIFTSIIKQKKRNLRKPHNPSSSSFILHPS